MAKNIKARKKLTKVFQFFAAYLVAAWTFLQFLDWIFNRYQLSPHWIDICLWVFIGIIPSILIYLYHQNRINKRILHLREKIIFPLNIILLLAFLLLSFNSKDLSAKTKKISYTNAAGKLEHKTILKEKYRTGIPLFNFNQENIDSNTAWINNAIPDLLFADLSQDNNAKPLVLRSTTTTDKISATKDYNDLYVDGSYEVNDGVYSITPTIRNSANGKLMASKNFIGSDLLKILDTISIYVREVAGINEQKRDLYPDLLLEEFVSSDLEAIKYYILGRNESPLNFAKAFEIDSTFTIAYRELAQLISYWNTGPEEAKFLFDKAYQFRKKLPHNEQFEIMLLDIWLIKNGQKQRNWPKFN